MISPNPLNTRFALRACMVAASVVGLAACSTLPSPPPDSTQFLQPTEQTTDNQSVFSCSRYYRELDRLIVRFHVQDAQTTAIRGYPYLHVNRLLAGLTQHIDHPDKLAMWLKLAAQLALQTNSIELNNLPESALQELIQIVPPHLSGQEPGSVLTLCSQTLLRYQIASTTDRQKILTHARVPDNYRTWQRIVGLYPIVSLAVAAGINNWHQKSSAVLQTPLANLPVKGRLTRYYTDTHTAYSDASDVQSAIDAAKQNPLGFPLLDSETQQRLFATFAPLWEIDTVQSDDKIGAPDWPSGEANAHVDTSRPTVYTLLSHAIFGGEILVQLNYIVWFPRRPCTSSLDFLCGHMDGLTWRVTLGTDGNPLIYDAIHNCGCYHTFFPTQYLRAIPPPPVTVESRATLDEAAFAPLQAPPIKPPQKLVLRIAPTSHHIVSVNVQQTQQDDSNYEEIAAAWDNYHTLRSLPHDYPPIKRKSLFQENAIVTGSQRKERWFFWPLGVPSAGAMRQWGNHATAFIGRRHFDEPYLFEHAFTAGEP
ncbi:MAG: hypothetical protein AMJ53_15865 [Gammaproteobacteria bacterium SG8_11]|nr:MAG: hypothetical protein AMJ53_15865 [Gammaproteobacteria bacterium SG8_11]